VAQVLVRALGFDVKKQDVIRMVHDVDPHNAGAVNYDQFIDMSKEYDSLLTLHHPVAQ
jgi:Ca2+-binding EF-hand superfamily protein